MWGRSRGARRIRKTHFPRNNPVECSRKRLSRSRGDCRRLCQLKEREVFFFLPRRRPEIFFRKQKAGQGRQNGFQPLSSRCRYLAYRAFPSATKPCTEKKTIPSETCAPRRLSTRARLMTKQSRQPATKCSIAEKSATPKRKAETETERSWTRGCCVECGNS